MDAALDMEQLRLEIRAAVSHEVRATLTPILQAAVSEAILAAISEVKVAVPTAAREAVANATRTLMSTPETLKTATTPATSSKVHTLRIEGLLGQNGLLKFC